MRDGRRRASAVEPEAALEVRPAHAEALAECGAPMAAAGHYATSQSRAPHHHECTRQPSRSVTSPFRTTAAARSALPGGCSARCSPDISPRQAALPPSDASHRPLGMMSRHAGEPRPAQTIARPNPLLLWQSHDLLDLASLRNSGLDRRKAVAELVPAVALDPTAGRVRGGGGVLSGARPPGGSGGTPELLQPDHLLERRRKRLLLPPDGNARGEMAFMTDRRHRAG